MELAPLGRTGRVTSRMGLGLAALGRPGYLNVGHGRDLRGRTPVTALERHVHEILDVAREADVRYFDVARSYGRGEDFLGSWLRLRGLPEGSLTIASKWGYVYTADWCIDATLHERKDHSLVTLERQILETRDRLGGHLFLWQIHSVTPDSGVLADSAVLDRLRAMRAGGLRIGLTTSGPRQADVVRTALGVRDGDRCLFDAVQVTWNLLETSVAPVLLDARRERLAVIVKEGLANGRLTPRNRERGFREIRRGLDAIAARHGVGIDAVALAWLLARREVDVVLSGATTADQLRSNLTALDVLLSAEDRETLETFAEPPERYWKRRARLRWT